MHEMFFEKKGFVENRHSHGKAVLGYFEAMKCHFLGQLWKKITFF